jgi:hypothetical protein
MLDTTSNNKSKRQRRYLKRLRQGKCCITLEVDAHIIDLVVRSKYCSEADSLDRGKLTKAVAALLADAKAEP